MNRLHLFRPALLLLLGLALPSLAQAQSQPAQGVLHAPSRTTPARRTPAPSPPKASPVAPVRQVAPFSSPVTHPPASALGHSAPGHAVSHKPPPRRAPAHHSAARHKQPTRAARRPPVVRAPKPPQARKAEAAPAAPGLAPQSAAVAAVAAVVAAVAKPPAADAVPPKAPERPPSDANKGTVTGLPLPRWVALRSADVNMRTGPGTRYPVEWQYHRRNLPVKLEREFGVWRLLEDQDGIKGWVHEANLTSRRGFVLDGPQQILRRDPSDTAGAVALLKPGVLGTIVSCKPHATWCQVRAGGYSGWLKRASLWGIFPGEAVTN